MSITIDSDAPRLSSSEERPCLCAQMSDFFSAAYDAKIITPEMKSDLKNNASSSCYYCKGTGVESVETDDAPTMQLSNANAEILFDVLGLEFDYAGTMSLPEARRALMRATSRNTLSNFTRPEESIYGKPREKEPGVIDMKPLKWHTQGLGEEQIKIYLSRFANFLHEISQRGAKKITWA